MENLIDNLLLAAAAPFFVWGIGLWIAALNVPEEPWDDDDSAQEGE